MIGTCCKCGRQILEACGECKTLRPTAEYVQRGLRLSTLQHHVTPFCRACAASLTPADYPTVLANIRSTFEHAWTVNQTPESLREQHRLEMADWQILGWADEVRGLEHGLQRPVIRRTDDTEARLGHVRTLHEHPDHQKVDGGVTPTSRAGERPSEAEPDSQRIREPQPSPTRRRRRGA